MGRLGSNNKWAKIEIFLKKKKKFRKMFLWRKKEFRKMFLWRKKKLRKIFVRRKKLVKEINLEVFKGLILIEIFNKKNKKVKKKIANKAFVLKVGNPEVNQI